VWPAVPPPASSTLISGAGTGRPATLP
jgi:hypothetical protein